MRKPCRRSTVFEGPVWRLPVAATCQAPRELNATRGRRPRDPSRALQFDNGVTRLG